MYRSQRYWFLNKNHWHTKTITALRIIPIKDHRTEYKSLYSNITTYLTFHSIISSTQPILSNTDHYERDIIDRQQKTYLKWSTIINSSCFKTLAVVHDFYKEHPRMYTLLIFHTCVQILKLCKIYMRPPWSTSVYVRKLSEENMRRYMQLLNHSFDATTKHISQPLLSNVHVRISLPS